MVTKPWLLVEKRCPLHCLGPPPQGRWWVGVLLEDGPARTLQ